MGNTFKKSKTEIDNVSIDIDKKNNDYNVNLKNFNLSEYNIIINNNDNNIILIKKNIIYIKDIDELNNFNINKSKIKKCKINDIRCDILKYKNIFLNILNIINDKNKIIYSISSKINIDYSEKNKNNKQYYYFKELKIYIKNTLSCVYIKEIYKLCNIHDIKLSMHVLTESEEYLIIHINIK